LFPAASYAAANPTKRSHASTAATATHGTQLLLPWLRLELGRGPADDWELGRAK
jgi:hypothetical protein